MYSLKAVFDLKTKPMYSSLKMRVAYIAHPIGGDVEKNLADLRQVILTINLTEPYTVPLCAYYADVVSMGDDNPVNRARGIRNDMHLLTRPGVIDEFRLYGDKISKGMREELLVALQKKLPIVCASEQLYNEFMAIRSEISHST